MAHLTADEFRELIETLAARMGTGRLGDRLVRVGALTSRRGIGTPQAPAERLYQLSAGMRRRGAAAVGLETLWRERIDEVLGTERCRRLEAVADRINSCLTPRGQPLPERTGELDAALAEYRGILSECLGPEEARLDMLLRAVPGVAARIRMQAPAAS